MTNDRASRSQDSHIILCERNSRTAEGVARHFAYGGSFSTLRELDVASVRRVSAVADGGGVYDFPAQHGWLLRFRDIYFRRALWAVFEENGALLLDTGTARFLLTADTTTVQYGRRGLLCSVRVEDEQRSISMRTMINPLCALLRDPAGELEDCQPVCEIFRDLSTASGLALWVHRWRQGLGITSLAFPAAQLP